MQKKVPQTLQHNKTCTLPSTQPQSHKGAHESLSTQVLTQLIQQSITATDFYTFDCFQKDLTQVLTILKQRIDEIIAGVGREVDRWRCQLGLGLKERDQIGACVEIGKGDKGDFRAVRCCDVYQIFLRVCQFGENRYNGAILQQKINAYANNVFNQLTEYIKPIEKLIVKPAEVLKNPPKPPQKTQQKSQTKTQKKQQPPPKSSQNPPKKIQQKRQQYSDNNSQKQCRPTRQIADRPRPVLDPTYNLKRIVDLEKTSKQTFTIRLKILRIIKYFNIKDMKKVQLKAGDETGTASCVFNKNQLLEVGNTIEVSNCRIYLFKGKVSQIQSQKNSKYIKVSPPIKDVWEDYDFTDSHRKNKKRYQTAKKVPGDQSKKKQIRGQSQQQDQFPIQDAHQYENPDFEVDSNHDSQPQPQPQNLSKIASESLSKISKIQPDTQKISLVAQIFKIIQEQKNVIDCYLGDETGIVRAELPIVACVKEGASVMIIDYAVEIVEEHILVRGGKGSKIQGVGVKFPRVMVGNDISLEAWVEEPEDDAN